MARASFDQLMAYALRAYRNGYPVVVFSSADEPLHGREFLEAVTDLGMPLQAFFVRGVARELWSASKYPDALEAARRLFMAGSNTIG